MNKIDEATFYVEVPEKKRVTRRNATLLLMYLDAAAFFVNIGLPGVSQKMLKHLKRTYGLKG